MFCSAMNTNFIADSVFGKESRFRVTFPPDRVVALPDGARHGRQETVR